jgi:outer membrane lipoprotein-sorting protein
MLCGAHTTSLAQDEWGIEDLMGELSRVKHAKLEFRETKKSIFLITNTTIEGNMEYRAPDYIEKNTLSPFLENLVIDGDTMVIEKIPTTGKVDDAVRTQTYSVESHPMLKAAVESIRAMLAGNYTTLTESYQIVLTGSRSAWELSLVPTADDILEYIERINLSGEETQIRKVVTIQADGDESTLELSYILLQ